MQNNSAITNKNLQGAGDDSHNDSQYCESRTSQTWLIKSTPPGGPRAEVFPWIIVAQLASI